MGNVYVQTDAAPGQHGALVTDDAPSNLGGTAEPGVSDRAARADHVHQRPTPADIGAATPSYVDDGDADTLSAAGAYTDNQVALVLGGVSAKPNIQAATTSAIPSLASVTLASHFSGYTPVQNDRVLVKDQVSQATNGWYSVGTVTSGVAALTRIADANASSEFYGVTTCLVARGSLAGKQYKTAQAMTFVLGTDPIVFTEIPATPLSDATPQAPGTAAAGTGTSASRDDHVHAKEDVTTTRGDLNVRGALGLQRLALGALRRILSSDGTDLVYQTIAALLDDVSSARGRILRRGASAWEALDASAADTFLGGDGTDVTVRTAAQALSSLDAARATSWDFSSSTGWTLVNGNGTAAITGGVASFTTANGADTTPNNSPTASVAIPATIDPWRGVDVAARLASFTGTLGSGNRAWISVQNVADGRNGTYPAASDVAVAAIVRGDGALVVGYVVGGTFNTVLTSATSTVSLAGTAWVRLQLRGAMYAVYLGSGASYPATWTRYVAGVIGSTTTLSADTTARAQPAVVTLSGYRAGAQAEAHVVTWDDLRVTGLL